MAVDLLPERARPRIITLLLIYVVAGGIETPRATGGVDLGGALLVSVALLSGVAALTLAGERGWADPLHPGRLRGPLLALAAFVLLELRLRGPLVDPRLFADRSFSSANLVSLLTGYTLATAIIGGPVFVNRVLNAGPESSAVALTALTVAIAGGAVLGGLRFGRRRRAGHDDRRRAADDRSGCGFAIGWGTDTGLERLVRDLAIFGAGFGLTVSPRATAAVEAAGASAYGVASAMLQITRTIGMSIGLALLTSIGQNRIDELTALINDARAARRAGAAARSPGVRRRGPAGLAGAWWTCSSAGRAARRPTCCSWC